MRDKYIEEVFPRYMIFGECKDGRVDVASVTETIVVGVSHADASRLISQRDSAVQKICDMARAFNDAAPEAFTAFWYGPNV